MVTFVTLLFCHLISKSYNDFIKKTTSELKKGPEKAQMTKPERKAVTEKMGRKPVNQRSASVKSYHKLLKKKSLIR